MAGGIGIIAPDMTLHPQEAMQFHVSISDTGWDAFGNRYIGSYRVWLTPTDGGGVTLHIKHPAQGEEQAIKVDLPDRNAVDNYLLGVIAGMAMYGFNAGARVAVYTSWDSADVMRVKRGA